MDLARIPVFDGNVPLPGFFDSLFGGFYLLKGVPLLGQLALLCGLAILLWYAWYPPQTKTGRSWRNTVAVLFFSVLALFLLQPWDEVFVNLRHAQHWALQRRFSFHENSWAEGTVEFLPLVFLGELARLGVPLADAGFALGLVCALGCLAITLRLWRAWGVADPSRWVLCVLLFAPLAFNSAHGFGTVGFLLGVLYAVWRTLVEPRTAGWIALAILPWVRVEAGLLVGLVWLAWCKTIRPRAPLAVVRGGALLAPLAAHTALRYGLYGEWLPIPVIYKSALGNPFFFLVGLRNLVADAIATHTLAAFLALASLRVLYRRKDLPFPLDPGQPLATARPALAVLALFCVPYYLSGGDWFPSYWGRYLLPFSFWLWITTVSAWICAWRQFEFQDRLRTLALPVAFALGSSLWPISSTWKFVDHVLSHRRTLAMIHEPTIARGHYRIQHLSRLGTLLGKTSEPSDRIGSSELATLMYFAQRDAVDMLGLTNAAIARSELRTLPSLFRRFPFRSELPYLIFRRLRPDWLEKSRPEFLFTFDFMLRDQLPDVRPYELTAPELQRALDRWEKQLGGLMDSLYGGIPSILRQGYSPVVVRAGEDFVALYFVHDKVRDRHFAALKQAGFKSIRLAGQSAAATAAER